MQDETASQETATENLNPQDTQKQNEVSHRYIEVGNDLFSKPDALAQILLVKNHPSTVVFCNSPSEADMVEVMLRKKNIPCSKLIGNIPYQRVLEELARLQTKEITALIITDVAARELEAEGFELVVNYGIHEDPEIYLHRITGYETSSKLREVLSLVSPLDFGNFHYLRKVVTFDFEKEDLPSDTALAKAQAQTLFASALEGVHLEDERVKSLLDEVLNNPDREKIVSLLLYNTICLLPKLQEEAASAGQRSGGNRNERGRDRDRDRDRNRDRDRDRNNRQPREDRYHSEGSEYRERREYIPPKREARLYLGHGIEQKFDRSILDNLIDSVDLKSADVIKRLTVRGSYSFLDVAEETADELMTKLDSAKLPNGEDLVIAKATYINVPHQGGSASDNELESPSSGADDSAETDADDANREEAYSDDEGLEDEAF